MSNEEIDTTISELTLCIKYLKRVQLKGDLVRND